MRLMLIIFLSLLCSCGRTSLPGRYPGAGSEHTAPEPLGSILQTIAIYTTWAGGLLFLAGVLIIIFATAKRTLGVQCLLAAVGSILAAQCIYWLGDHLRLFAFIVLGLTVLTMAGYAWLSRKTLIKKAEGVTRTDLDGDGLIGGE